MAALAPSLAKRLQVFLASEAGLHILPPGSVWLQKSHDFLPHKMAAEATGWPKARPAGALPHWEGLHVPRLKTTLFHSPAYHYPREQLDAQNRPHRFRHQAEIWFLGISSLWPRLSVSLGRASICLQTWNLPYNCDVRGRGTPQQEQWWLLL